MRQHAAAVARIRSVLDETDHMKRMEGQVGLAESFRFLPHRLNTTAPNASRKTRSLETIEEKEGGNRSGRKVIEGILISGISKEGYSFDSFGFDSLSNFIPQRQLPEFRFELSLRRHKLQGLRRHELQGRMLLGRFARGWHKAACHWIPMASECYQLATLSPVTWMLRNGCPVMVLSSRRNTVIFKNSTPGS